jgi:RNA polymerase sigma factor (sigma-70 family)
MSSPTPDEARKQGAVPDELLEQREFLRRIAQGLVGDRHRADDVVQDAYVAALEHPPQILDGLSRAHSIRAWLTRVVQNLSLNSIRREGRLAAREQSKARREALPSHETMLERIELSKQLMDSLQALPDNYRGVLYLRFFEGRGVGEIAADMQLPRETVKTRLRRGLGRLRADLDLKVEGGSASWMAALLPLVLSPPLLPIPLGTGLEPAVQAAQSSSAGSAAVGGTLAPVGTLLGVLVMKKFCVAKTLAELDQVRAGNVWCAAFMLVQLQGANPFAV